MTEQLAQRFFDAIERGDVDAVGAIYAPDAVIWHNDDALETSREENLEVLRNFVAHTAERHYEQRRVAAFDGGFVQQHALRIVGPNGGQRTIHAAIICQVVDDRITRLDEYFDPAQIQPSRR